ncbi:Uncharacterised protein [Leminorella richardii]|uniref:Uncharacterized protein n=1 Tax=Leminorella richardii TaxID=158841 RepID=A0A2X4UP98_9GAMM|nr:transporter [Leminorella richardii]SQI40591.1 Uncharacterised protein [Leminorella richardii]
MIGALYNVMQKKLTLSLSIALLAYSLPCTSATKAYVGHGAPVNINVAGASVLAEGKAIVTLNSSFRDKTHQVEGTGSSDTFTQIWLLKMRYGLTDRLELVTSVPYTNNRRDDMYPEYIDGLGDMPLTLSYALLSQRAGDPFWLTLKGGFLLPTGQRGDNHLAGSNAWGGKAGISATRLFTPQFKGDLDFIVQGPFERGNSDVKRGTEYQISGQLRYLPDSFPVDIGLETTYSKSENGNKKINGRSVITTRQQKSGF